MEKIDRRDAIRDTLRPFAIKLPRPLYAASLLAVPIMVFVWRRYAQRTGPPIFTRTAAKFTLYNAAIPSPGRAAVSAIRR